MTGRHRWFGAQRVHSLTDPLRDLRLLSFYSPMYELGKYLLDFLRNKTNSCALREVAINLSSVLFPPEGHLGGTWCEIRRLPKKIVTEARKES